MLMGGCKTAFFSGKIILGAGALIKGKDSVFSNGRRAISK